MARRFYTAEFKREAVRQSRTPGVGITRVARELGIHPNSLRDWGKKFDAGTWETKEGAELKSMQSRELERVKRELAKVTMERDILKKALAYFAKEPK